MAPRRQEPISQNRVRTNRLRAITTADSAERRTTPAETTPPRPPTQAEINAMNMAGLQGMTMLPGFVPAQRRSQQEAQRQARQAASAESAATAPQVLMAPPPPPRTPYTAPTFTPVSSRNPYLDYQAGLTAMADQAAANFGAELADVQNRYKALRDQVLAQFGNTKNPELIAARDIALAELGRQAEDATKQVAANYQAAQADQTRFAEQQRALGAELGAQNAILANVAAGNVAAYADQAGLTDSAAQDTAAFLASQAPRQQALATALGLSGGMFEASMGTSLGEQQMAIQGQIARDLAARQGQVSTSTAQQIAAAQQAEREAQRQAYLNLVMEEMGALDRARGQMTERDFALRQAVLQGGVEAGRFAVEQDRYNRDLQNRLDEQAYNRWLADQELGLKQQTLDLNRAEVAAKTAGQAPTTYELLPQAKTLADWIRANNPEDGGVDAMTLEQIAYEVGDRGLTVTNEQLGQLAVMWASLTPATQNALRSQGVSSLQDYANSYLKAGGVTPSRPATGTTTTARGR